MTSKHLLGVYDRPMVLFPLKTLVDSGIDEIILVVGGKFAGDYIRVLGDGKEFNIRKLHYVYQNSADGIASAISLCEEFTENESVAVILGDNIYSQHFFDSVQSFKSGAKVFLKDVGFEEAKRFGCPKITKNGKIINITEKPKDKPASPYAVTGMYLFDNTVFDRIRTLEFSDRKELEVSSLNETYIKDKLLDYEILDQDSTWIDAGLPSSILLASVWASINAN